MYDSALDSHHQRRSLLELVRVSPCLERTCRVRHASYECRLLTCCFSSGGGTSVLCEHLKGFPAFVLLRLVDGPCTAQLCTGA